MNIFEIITRTRPFIIMTNFKLINFTNIRTLYHKFIDSFVGFYKIRISLFLNNGFLIFTYFPLSKLFLLLSNLHSPESPKLPYNVIFTSLNLLKKNYLLF